MAHFFTGLYEVYMRVNWFISMSVFNTLHPIIHFAVIIPFILIIFPFLFNHKFFCEKKIKDFSIKIRLANMAVIWFTIGIIGSAFVDRGRLDFNNLDIYANYSVLFLFLFFFIFGIHAIYKNKNYRIISIACFLINSYFNLFITFIAGMAISGTWL